MNPLVVIPTYISARRVKEMSTVIATYDRMTPLTKQGSLARCLSSLRTVRSLGRVAVLVVAEGAVENQAYGKVAHILEGFPEIDIVLVGAPELVALRRRMEQLGIDAAHEVGLSGYSAIRNLGFVLAHALGHDAVVFMDDNETAGGEEFLERAMYGLGKLTRRRVPILAKSGFYLNEEGSYRSSASRRWYNAFWDQGNAFDAWITQVMAGPRLTRSNHVCGGCMAVHKEAFKRVAFDPWIPRGEDLDYMLSLRMYGSDMWFDNTWSLTRESTPSNEEGLRFRQDIYRWLYEYRKVEYARTQIDLMQIKPASLMPYPGSFLEPGITKRAKRTAWLRSIARPDSSGYRRAARSVPMASRYAEENCMKYFGFQYRWPALIARMENDAYVQRMFASQSETASWRRGAAAAACEDDAHREGSARDLAHPRYDEPRDDGESLERPHLSSTSVDPGLTSEIRLNLPEDE